MNEITVRNSRVSDTESIYKLLRVIADLHRTARPDMFDGLVSKYTESEVEKRLSNEDNGVFVAEIEGAVVGYVFCEVIKEGSGNTLYIDDLCVDENARKQGVGKLLVDKAGEYAKQKSCTCLMLNVWEFNENAISFYEKYGFTTRTRRMELKFQ